MKGKFETCPVCNSKDYKSVYYTEEYWGIVEEHGCCNRCGYIVEMAYSQPVVGFEPPVRRGHKSKYNGEYYPKNIRKRKRMKRKFNIKYKLEDRFLALI